MIVKIYSWLLACAYLAWGVWLLLFIPRYHEAFLSFNVPMPFLIRVMFIAGPLGCLLVTALIGAFIVLNTQKFHVRYTSLILTIALLAWVGYATNVIFDSLSTLVV